MEFTVMLAVLVVAVVTANLVEAVKRTLPAGIFGKWAAFVWLVASVAFAVGLGEVLFAAGVTLNLFADLGAKATQLIALVTCALAGALGPSIYNLQEWVRQDRK